MARRGVLGLMIGSAVAMLSGCSFRKTLRYKMTIKVDTPEGVRSGYAVREVMRKPPSILDYAQAGLVKGEAVAVDLPNGQTLFALLTGENGDVDYAGRWIPQQNLGFGKNKEIVRTPVVIWPHAPVPQKQQWLYAYPMLVRFKDISDPKSIDRIDKSDLSVTFGEGYALRRIEVEVTNEPVTQAIGARLNWLDQMDHYNFEKDGPFDQHYPREVLGLRER